MSGYYVYTLTDPRNLTIFYVGKGCGDRLNDHVREAIAGRVSNQAKTDRIKSILDAKQSVITNIVSRHDDEAAALDAEAALICTIDGLTNIMSRGCISSSIKCNVRATIDRMMALASIDSTSLKADVASFGKEFLESVEMLEAAFAKTWPNKEQVMVA